MLDQIPGDRSARDTALRAVELGATGFETRRHEPRPGLAVLWVAGEVDTLTAPLLTAALTGLLDETAGSLSDAAGAGGRATPVVDLSGVTFLASSGLAVLIRAAHRVAAGGRGLHLVACSRAVTRPLEITGSDQLFVMHRGLDEKFDGC